MFLADLHIHSKFSDGKLAIPEIVDLYGSKGFGAIAITDHLCESTGLLGKAALMMNRTLTPGTFPIYLEILKSEAARAWDKYQMVVLPGVELTKNPVINHRSARILGLGISKYISADGDVVELARAIRAQGAVAVAGDTLWNRRGDLAGEVDAWEVATGRKLNEDILESGLPKIATSGLHSTKHLSSWKTLFSCERHPQAILDAIRTQDLRLFFYEEMNNELRNVVDFGGVGVRNRADAGGDADVRGTFPLEVSQGQLRVGRVGGSGSSFDPEAFKGRGLGAEREPRELF